MANAAELFCIPLMRLLSLSVLIEMTATAWPCRLLIGQPAAGSARSEPHEKKVCDVTDGMRARINFFPGHCPHDHVCVDGWCVCIWGGIVRECADFPRGVHGERDQP
jgi:hypothetical protein